MAHTAESKATNASTQKPGATTQDRIVPAAVALPANAAFIHIPAAKDTKLVAAEKASFSRVLKVLNERISLSKTAYVFTLRIA
jgi:hypothetical protein